jgi:hypothetical protein
MVTGAKFIFRWSASIQSSTLKGAVMKSKYSMLKVTVVAAALAAGVSGVARADDSSMNPFTGDSYAYFNGGNLGHVTQAPVFASGPSAWRQSNPNGLTNRAFAALGSEATADRFNPPVISVAAADPTWRTAHPTGLTNAEFAALGSEEIAARQPPNQATTALASTNGPVYANSTVK